MIFDKASIFGIYYAESSDAVQSIFMTPEKARLIKSAIYPAILIGIFWAIKIFETISGLSFARFGILPLQSDGLYGIICAPLLHADFAHLAANSVPFFVLSSALFYFYREIAFRVLALSWLLTGFWVWCFARGGSYHIGASGVVYALATFHFVSGLIRREPKLMAFTLLVVFLYGSMVWGVFPDFFPTKNISWESHLMGFIAGLILAVYYRHTGPQRPVYAWDDDDTEEIDYSGNEPLITLSPNEDPPDIKPPSAGQQNEVQVKLNYIFRKD
jgi:membrane associated rhomboid family serine protease